MFLNLFLVLAAQRLWVQFFIKKYIIYVNCFGQKQLQIAHILLDILKYNVLKRLIWVSNFLV